MVYKIGIIGASGYTGVELIRILKRHPGVELTVATALEVGKRLSDIFACPYDVLLQDAKTTDFKKLDAVFCSLPHGASMDFVRSLRAQDVRVIDFSADFRMKSVETYEKWYKIKHSAPGLLSEAVYGLPELNREKIAKTKFVANPGCYPTTVILGLAPLLPNENIDIASIIVDAKSGVSGAGRKVDMPYMFCEANENFSPYSVGHVHRHVGEIEDQLSILAGAPASIVFSPHLLPLTQGMMSSIYVKFTRPFDLKAVHQQYVDRYAKETFVRVLPLGQYANIHHVAHTNYCCISLAAVPEKSLLLVTSCIDNLIKGASGQAVQNMNLVLGLPEAAGLI